MRRWLLLVLAADLAAAIVACSDSNPPAATSMTTPEDAGKSETGTLSDAGADSAVDASDDADAGPGFECLDDKPAPADAGANDADCTKNGCTSVCNDVTAHFKLGVAQVAMACIAKLPNCTTPSDAIPCLDYAMARACADPVSPGYCTPLAKPCDPEGNMITESACETFANGMTDAGRATFASCIQSEIEAGTCQDQVGTCADQIRY